MVRRLVAAGVGIVVLLLVVLLFRGCLNSRKESAYREYVRDVSAWCASPTRRARTCSAPWASPANASDVEIQNQLNTFSGQAEQIVERAEALDTPDDLKGAQSYLGETLKFRRDGVKAIATPAARGQSPTRATAGEGVEQVAASMQNFLASDVIYQTRFVPACAGRSTPRTWAASRIPRSRFLPEPDWVLPATVADRVPKLGGSGPATRTPRPACTAPASPPPRSAARR